MSGPQDIQRPARGLVDLLGLKSTGDSPRMIGAEISGKLELLDLYLADRRTTTQNIAASTITAVGFKPIGQLAASIPQPGYLFFVYSIMVTLRTQAASSWEGAIVVMPQRFVGLQGYTYIASNPWPTAALENLVLGRYFERPLIMQPGDTIGVMTSAVTGTIEVPDAYIDFAPVLA